MADLFVGTINNDQQENNELWFAVFNVNGEPVKFKMDTGLQANILPREEFNNIKGSQMSKPRCSLVTFSGHRMTPDGEATFKINGQSIGFQIVRGVHPILRKQVCVTLVLIARIGDVYLQPTQTTQNDENESSMMYFQV